MIGISACLIGEAVRYDGGHKQQTQLKQLVDNGEAIVICPEVLGGLSVPREPSEMINGDGVSVWSGQSQVATQSGKDVTQAFKQWVLQQIVNGTKMKRSICTNYYLTYLTPILKNDCLELSQRKVWFSFVSANTQ